MQADDESKIVSNRFRRILLCYSYSNKQLENNFEEVNSVVKYLLR